MNGFRADCLILIRIGLVILAMGFAARSSFAQALEYQDYLRRIEELDQTGSDLARTKGKAALISEYRALIDSNPEYANNLQLETQIGYVYEWDLSASGEPPDMKAAYNQYVAVSTQYEPDQPYMKTIRELAANRAVTVDPKAASDLYQGILHDYPEDSGLTEESLFYLGRLAEERGDAADAAKYYEAATNFQPAQELKQNGEANAVDAYRANAALGLLSQAIKQSDNPEQRMKALEDFLASHPGFAEAHAELISGVRDALQQQATQMSNVPLSAALQNLASTLGGGPRKGGVPGGLKVSSAGTDHTGAGATVDSTVPKTGTPSTATASARSGSMPTVPPAGAQAPNKQPTYIRAIVSALVVVAVLSAIILVRRRLG